MGSDPGVRPTGFLGKVASSFSDHFAQVLGIALAGLAFAFLAVYLPKLGADPADGTATPQIPDTSTATPGSGSGAPEVMEPCDQELEDGGQWVQVESYKTAPTEWVVPQVAASVGTAFCDGSRLVADGSPVLMMGRPLRAADVDALAEAAPPAALAEICEIWRLLRVAGGALPYQARDMSTYFSDFVLVPDTVWIGADLCFPFLSGDEEYGSRAALDRYFSTLSALGAGKIDEATATALLEEVTTSAFREKSGGVPGILSAWEGCAAVVVTHIGAPSEVRGFDQVEVHTECRADAVDTRDLVLAVAPPAVTGEPWRLHWSPDRWGPPPATA